MRRILAAVFVATTLTATVAQANGADPADKASDKEPAEQAAVVQPPIPPPGHANAPKTSRPFVLPILYSTFATTQAYDVYSTRRAIGLGADEANPNMRFVVSNPALFIGLKALMTVGPIVAAEQMWRDHHRVRAIALMAAANGIMAAVAVHNTSVIRSQQIR